MARPLRLDFAGACWHLTSRGNERKNVFRTDRDRREFLALLGELTRRYQWVVYAYVLMSNHFHLVIETPEPTLSRGMQWLLGTYAGNFNRRHQRVGHLFQGRFKGVLVEKETQLLNVLRYTVLNPVRAKMVASPEEYPWSSYRATAGLCESPAWLSSESILGNFAQDQNRAKQLYKVFIHDQVAGSADLWKDLVEQIYLGSEEWRATIQKKIDSRLRCDEHPGGQRRVARPKMADIAPVVAEVYGVDEREVRFGHGGEARRVAAWLGCFEGMLTRRQIAAGLKLASAGRITALIRECDKALDKDPQLQMSIDRCCDLLRGSPTVVLQPRVSDMAAPIPH